MPDRKSCRDHHPEGMPVDMSLLFDHGGVYKNAYVVRVVVHYSDGRRAAFTPARPAGWGGPGHDLTPLERQVVELFRGLPDGEAIKGMGVAVALGRGGRNAVAPTLAALVRRGILASSRAGYRRGEHYPA